MKKEVVQLSKSVLYLIENKMAYVWNDNDYVIIEIPMNRPEELSGEIIKEDHCGRHSS